MIDHAFRNAERRWLESRSPEAEADYLQRCLRAEVLAPDQVERAALVGRLGARLVLGWEPNAFGLRGIAQELLGSARVQARLRRALATRLLLACAASCLRPLPAPPAVFAEQTELRLLLWWRLEAYVASPHRRTQRRLNKVRHRLASWASRRGGAALSRNAQEQARKAEWERRRAAASDPQAIRMCLAAGALQRAAEVALTSNSTQVQDLTRAGASEVVGLDQRSRVVPSADLVPSRSDHELALCQVVAEEVGDWCLGYADRVSLRVLERQRD